MYLITEVQNRKQKLAEVKRNTEIHIYCYIFQHSSVIDRRDRKIDKCTKHLTNTINQLDQIDIYRTLHTTAAKYTFFLSAFQTFTKTDYRLGHKTMFNIFRGLQSYKVYSLTIWN